MAAHGNDFGHLSLHQIDASHAARLGNPTAVDPDQLSKRVAALLRGAIPRAGLGAAKIGDICDRSVCAHHRGHRQHTERHRFQQRAAVGVEDREGVVSRQGHHHHAVSGCVGASRYSGSTGDVVTELRRSPPRHDTVAVVGSQLRDGLRLRETL